MKLLKNSFIKKTIIILIVLLCFNTIYPDISFAVDIGGILLSPIYMMTAALMVTVDAITGAVVQFQDFSATGIGGAVDSVMENTSNATSKFFIGPDSYFTGAIETSRANIFRASNYTGTLGQVVRAVAGFYVVLRNIAAIVMLAGLIFTGIKILLSSNIPTQKTQYLMLLQDWIIGMALLIFSHIIMILIFEISDALVRALQGSLLGTGSLKLELLKQVSFSFDTSTQMIALALYSYSVWLTIVFSISYMKRFFWTCILVVFAPVFSVMYAFGAKTKQIYSNWLKEFIMNAFVQPFHLVVYAVLFSLPVKMTSGGFNLSTSNGFEMSYALTAMTMIRPAEKWMRSMFGMDKGIAAMASYDSGMKTIGSIAKAVVTVVAAAFTGGTAAAAMKGAGAIAKGAQAASKMQNMGGNKMAQVANKTEAMAEAKAEAITGGDDALNQYLNEGGKQNAFGHYYNPNIDEFDENYDPRKDSIYNKQLEESDSEKDKAIDASDSGFKEAIAQGVEEGNEESKEKEENKDKGKLDTSTLNITAGTVNMQGDTNNQENGEIKTIEEASIDEANTEEENNNGDSDVDLELDEGKSSLKDKLMAARDSGMLAKFATLGNDLSKGLHSITDTMYVDGGASGDWQNSTGMVDQLIKRSEEKNKQRNEIKQATWANDKINIDFMTNKYLPSMEKIYKGKPEDYIRNKAEEKAKSELGKMSQFVPYGITNIQQVSKLHDDAKTYGLTPEQAIKREAGYKSFNTAPANINVVNKSEAFVRNDYKTIEQAIPAAEKYYKSGYTSVNDMAVVEKIRTELEKIPQYAKKATPEYAMKLDQTLKKKGGNIKYNGKDTAVADVIKQINDSYK